MAAEIRIETAAFEAWVRQSQAQAVENAKTYGTMIGEAFVSDAKSGASWVTHQGVAKGGINSQTTASGHLVKVLMGASAPNYKKGPKSSDDYFEYLEFGHHGNYAIIYPTFDSLTSKVNQNLPDAVIRGIPNIQRDAEAARARGKRRTRSRHR